MSRGDWISYVTRANGEEAILLATAQQCELDGSNYLGKYQLYYVGHYVGHYFGLLIYV